MCQGLYNSFSAPRSPAHFSQGSHYSRRREHCKLRRELSPTLCPRLILAFSQDAVSIENALYEDGRVLSCAAVAVPDARLGELPVAFVVPKLGVQIIEVELLDFIRPRSVSSLSGFRSTWDILRIY